MPSNRTMNKKCRRDKLCTIKLFKGSINIRKYEITLCIIQRFDHRIFIFDKSNFVLKYKLNIVLCRQLMIIRLKASTSRKVKWKVYYVNLATHTIGARYKINLGIGINRDIQDRSATRVRSRAKRQMTCKKEPSYSLYFLHFLFAVQNHLYLHTPSNLT